MLVMELKLNILFRSCSFKKEMRRSNIQSKTLIQIVPTQQSLLLFFRVNQFAWSRTQSMPWKPSGITFSLGHGCSRLGTTQQSFSGFKKWHLKPALPYIDVMLTSSTIKMTMLLLSSSLLMSYSISLTITQTKLARLSTCSYLVNLLMHIRTVQSPIMSTWNLFYEHDTSWMLGKHF